MKLVWYTSLLAGVHSARSDNLFSAFHPAGDDGDDGDIANLGPTGGAGPLGMRPARLRRTPRLGRSNQKDKEVVIVGAGYAGWGAAARLVEGGVHPRDITILEADTTFGGRARKDDAFAPFPLDLGPSFVPGRFRGELAALAGVPVEDLPLVKVEGVHGWYLWQGAVTYYDFLADNIIAKLDVCESKSKCRKQAKNMGLKFKGNAAHEGAYGCYSNPDQKKVFWGDSTDKQNYTGHLSGWQERINCDRINKEYGCQVTSVNYENAKRVNTTCDNGKSFESTQVIVAVPLSVLKYDDITFEPPLPIGIQQNVNERGWFDGFKLFLEFNTTFKPEPVMAFGDSYDRDKKTGQITGEHYFWDHTKYSAPDFEGKVNILEGTFIGTKADDFDGMNETQIVEETLKKFGKYYSDEDGYTDGYHPDSYQRHLLVNWDNPEVKPFVRGTYSTDSDTYAGHRADDDNRIFVAGEAFPAPLDEFCSSPKYCYHHIYWDKMPEEIQEAYTVLGWDQKSWDDDENHPDTEEMYWNVLTGDQKEAAALIGYTEESWDEHIECLTTAENCYFEKWWWQLHKKIQEAYAVLGYDKKSWNNGSVPDTMQKTWDQLTEDQLGAAKFIGYTPEIWGEGLEESAKPAAVVEYESEAWVYTALHSGQKAAEMILALQSWSDLFSVEDFGTFGGTLGVFQACSNRAQVKGNKDKFYLELQAGSAESCAKTKYFELSGGATKIRIAFKLLVKNFKIGDWFSVEIATNGQDDYKEILSAGKSGTDSGGGLVEIPAQNKWYNIKKLHDGWLVKNLDDLGTGGIDRISLKFRVRAAHEKSKVKLDNVLLQEFVPM